MPAKVDEQKCTGCESCIAECPGEAISMAVGKVVIDVDSCIDCGVYVDACAEEAISME